MTTITGFPRCAGPDAAARARRQPSCLSLVILALIACGDASAPAVPAHLEPVAGAGQEAVVGEALAPLEVRVTTESGRPLAAAEVSWTVAAGRATLAPESSTTDADGLARTTVVLGSRAGDVTVTASVRRLPPARFTLTALPDDPTAVAVWAGDDQSALVGTPLAAPITAAVLDRHGNRVPGIPVILEAEQGRLTTSSVSGPEGLVDAVWTLGEDPGEQVATAWLGAPTEPVTFRAIALAGPPAAVVKLRGDIQHGAAGSTLRNPLVVRVTDPFGNPIPNAIVSFSSPQGGSFDPPVAVTRADGETESTWTLGVDTSVSVTHSATASAAGGVSTTFTATARDPCVRAPYAVETTHTGRLEAGDCQLPQLRGDTSYVDLYAFDVAVQATYELEVVSADFVPYVLFLPSFVQARGRGGDRARLVVTAAPDSYELAVTSVGPVPGVYTLSSRTRSDLVEGCPSELWWLLGSVQTSQVIEEGDCALAGGGRGDIFSFSLQGGESVALTMTSEVLNPVLTLYVLTNSGYTRVIADTGAAATAPAEVRRTASQFGFYLVTAGGPPSSAAAEYTLDVLRTAPAGGAAVRTPQLPAFRPLPAVPSLVDQARQAKALEVRPPNQ